MSKIKGTFEGLKSKNQSALITYTTYGYPTIEKSDKILALKAEAGVDIIEVGIPYSDPLADGPVIQRASSKALENGVTLDVIFTGIKKFRENYDTPLVLMGYFNAVRAYGFEKFIDQCKAVDIDGAIIPDLPLEERTTLKDLFDEEKMDLITMVAPTSLERVEALSKDTSGFIYCVSSLGVTGSEMAGSDRLNTTIDKIRSITETPMALGFGIKRPETIENFKGKFDGYIIGSEVIRKIEEDENGEFKALISYLKDVKGACVKSK